MILSQSNDFHFFTSRHVHLRLTLIQTLTLVTHKAASLTCPCKHVIMNPTYFQVHTN